MVSAAPGIDRYQSVAIARQNDGIDCQLPRHPVDKFDRQIIAILRADARTPVSQIARVVNLSRSAVSERIHHLEHEGVIRGYHAQITEPGNGAVKAFLELFYKDNRCAEYVQRMRAFSEIRRCCGISGETDMLVYVEAPSVERLSEIRGEIERYPGLEKIKTHMVVQEWAM